MAFLEGSDIYFSSVGFTNPKLGLVSHNLNEKNFGIVSRTISVNNKDLKNKTIKTYDYKNQDTIRDALLKINPLNNKHKWTFIDKYPDNQHKTDIGKYENIFHPSATILANFNNYKFIYNQEIPVVDGYIQKEDKTLITQYNKAKVSPALFNPLFMVQHLGISPYVPLLNTAKGNTGASSSSKSESAIEDISNCTIRELVRLSYKPHSILGLATYRYVDFMYCKDLGKVANNHLITLRKFAYPIGDNIFEYYDESAGDIGRLVTWFDTEDNKLENILSFQYQASWKELQAKIEEIESKEDSSNRGPVGMLLNSLNPAYNKMQGAGHTGHQNIFGFFGIGTGYSDDNREILRNYDKNKVYTPKNTVQDTVTYEGKLTFTHEFNLTFSYKLRAYDSINPKSAFLDLLGNIMNVTYRRGKFWGGDRKWIGPPQNVSGWQKANAMIDGNWKKTESVLGGLFTGTTKLADVLGMISGALQNLVGNAKEVLNQLKSGGVSGAVSKIGEFLQSTGLNEAALGVLKNKLGRPALYAMDSLLKGDNVGLWHVTIGNPKNPIASMGNLILTNAQFQTFGPLGLDDFPTEIKLTVTLKHARSRDAVEIGRMFTKGTNGIYYSSLGKNINQWFPRYINNHVNITEGDETTRISEQEALVGYNEYDNGILIQSPYAAKIDQSNQSLSYDLSVVLDEIA